MKTRIGINGFGRMGRLALRAAWGSPDLEFVHINELKGDSEVAAHLLTFDSVHGRWNHDVRATKTGIEIDDVEVPFTSHAAPADVPWKEHGVDQKGSENIWIAVIGPDTKPLGERSKIPMVAQAQIASTVAALLGKDYVHDVPKAAAPIRDVLAETHSTP